MNFNKQDIQEIIDLEIKQAEKKYGKEFKLILLKVLSYEKMLNPDKPIQEKEPVPLAEWDKYHKYPTVRAMRNYYFNKDENGFSYCVVMNGHRILIDEDKFFYWMKNRKAS